MQRRSASARRRARGLHPPSRLPQKANLCYPLKWDSSYDENDNTTLEAPGGTTDGESVDLYYRLRQEVRNNAHVWVEASNPELMIDGESPLRWQKKHEALRAIQRHHDAIMRDYSCQPSP